MEIPHFPQEKTNTQNCVSLCSLLSNQVLLKEDQKSLKLYTITMNFEFKQKCKLFAISACWIGRWLNNFNMPFFLFIISFIDISGIFSCIMTENIAQFLGAYCLKKLIRQIPFFSFLHRSVYFYRLVLTI